MGRTPSSAITNVHDLLWYRCRSYATRPKYPQLVVFSKWKSELDLLVHYYGGNYYRHGSGFIWSVSKHETLITIVNIMRERFPSRHEFEKLIIQLFLTER
jgi:hypothetical protein